MDYFTEKSSFGVSGFTSDFFNLMPDSIRYPPSANIPRGLISTPGLNLKLTTDIAALNPKLDDYLVYIFETLNNIYIIIKDLINNYK